MVDADVQGGKGAATTVGTLVVLAPKLVLPLVLVWAFVLTQSGYVGLSTMSAAVALPIWLGVTRLPEDQPLFIYVAFMALFIIYCHRSNIRRMRDGTENRNINVMLFKPKQHAHDDDNA